MKEKSCEICGRVIRSGRKYCWEHRKTAQAESTRISGIINKASMDYYNSKIEKNNKTLYTIIILLEIIWIVLAFSLFDVNSDLFPYLFGYGFFIMIFLSFFIGWKFFDIKFQYGRKIKREVKEKSPEFTKYIKSKIKEYKKEQEWRKYMSK